MGRGGGRVLSAKKEWADYYCHQPPHSLAHAHCHQIMVRVSKEKPVRGWGVMSYTQATEGGLPFRME